MSLSRLPFQIMCRKFGKSGNACKEMMGLRMKSNSPVHEYGTARIESILDELDTVWKVLEKVLVVHVVHLYDLVMKALEQLSVQGQSQDGKNVRDASGL